MERPQELQAKSLAQDCNPILTLGGRVSQGTTLTVLAVAGLGSGLVLGWDSLVALGASTFILALLPCAVMCALGICASRMGKKDAGGTSNAVTQAAEDAASGTPAAPGAIAVDKSSAPADRAA